MDSYIAHLIVFVGIYWILASSLDLALGYCGLFNIGHAAFFGIGAYTAALLTRDAGVPFVPAWLIGGILAALVAFLLGLSVLRLYDDYLALATLAFGVIVEGVLRNWTGLTGGSRGLGGIPQVSMFGVTLASPLTYAALVMTCAAMVAFLLKRISKSHFGRVVQSIRSDQIAAASFGTNVKEYKLTVLALSACFAGLAGGLYAHYLGSLDPGRFTINESFLIVSMVVIGGTTSLRGAFIGAALLLLLTEPLRLLELTSPRIAAIREMLFALTLLGVVLLRPQGIVGKKVLSAR